jgi:hypothetical protein
MRGLCATASRGVRFTPLAVLAALIATTLTFGLGGSGPALAEPPKPPGPKASRAALAKLKIAPRGSYAGYDRDHFGDDWTPAGESCDTRDRVLQRDGRNVRTASGCRITGTWRSPYDGVIVTVSRNVDIDHVVPLGHAWRTGAKTWAPARREAFANDLREPQLVAVTYRSNRSKGDDAPDEWKPPRRAIWCLYARWWIDVKTAWQLTTTRPERTSLRAMLRRC